MSEISAKQEKIIKWPLTEKLIVNTAWRIAIKAVFYSQA